ncbi:DNA-directed RNA polymerase sigma-70 factor [Clostridium zeae]|uniref:DNA-directed RNA polymerase sigma-70 factor n=1 Tax=Clostridium zeae TaxID=2759022 RepID=A0ABQ1E7P7_9CLOT|nr:sigma-70 family RNA polymerase sigma factor [Clostridium zeae]GFZ30802.1 DNA-directed RNA polymerase sigma-70 factor [Clostridium zeae]
MTNITKQIDNGIIQKHADMVYKLALSRTKSTADSEDIFQEVFYRYFSSKIKFQSEDHIKAWLLRVTINCSNKLFTTAWFRRTVPLVDDIEFTEEENEVYISVLELPLKYRTVIHLHYYEDMSISDMSKILKIKESTIKSQLHRAKALLKIKLKGEYGDV